MSFLDNIKANKGTSNGVNPFISGGNKMNNNSNNNPFAPKTSGVTGTANIAAVAPGIPMGAKPTTSAPSPFGGSPSPSMSTPKAPSFAKPTPAPTAAPSMPKPQAPSFVKTAQPEETVKAEEVKSTEAEVKETKVEEVVTPAVEIKEEKVVEAKEEKAEEVKEVKEEAKEEKKASPKKKASSKKKASESKTVTKEVVDSPEAADIIETIFKMPSTTIKYAEAIQAIKSKFVDEEWENFRKEIIAESDDIVIESDMQEGAMKKTIAKLNALREKIWVNFVDTKALFESLSNKDTEGLIERVKFASLEGSNETVRKKAGVLAVMNYVTPEGEKINLYEVYDETKNRFYFLKSVMDTIKYKSDVLITMSSAIKMEKGHSHN